MLAEWSILAVLLAGEPAPSPPLAAPALDECLPGEGGALRARLRGALDLDLDWHGARVACDGGPRPDGDGLRLSIAGPKQSDGRRLRFVFGIRGAREGAAGRALPTNLTVIFEGENRLFATRGEARCTTDELAQQRIGDLGGPRRTWRVAARGFCVGPATTLDQSERLLVTSFDFVGRLVVEDEP
jgi:hypothetical protein